MYRTYLVAANEARYAAVVADLHARLFPNVVFPYPHYGDWWVTYEGKLPVAFAHTEPTTFYPNSGYFGRVGVLPDHRGHGLQFHLMKKAEVHAREVRLYEALYSDTTRVKHSAANFVRRRWTKFEPAPDLKVQWGSKDTVYWRKTL